MPLVYYCLAVAAFFLFVYGGTFLQDALERRQLKKRRRELGL
jgi:hypothetical protein